MQLKVKILGHTTNDCNNLTIATNDRLQKAKKRMGEIKKTLVTHANIPIEYRLIIPPLYYWQRIAIEATSFHDKQN